MKTYLLSASLTLLIAGAQAQSKDAIVEKFSRYPGGTEKFFDYVKSELIYPKDALKDSLTGIVHVGFIVSATGKILPETIRIIKSLSPSCDEEAMRIIRKAPNWNPGTAKLSLSATKAVEIDQQITFPIAFSLDKK